LSSLPVWAAGAQSQSSEAFVVDLQTDGSATVTLQRTFDLTTDSELASFRKLRDNETKAAGLRNSFADRLRSVARTTANQTGGSMGITDATISVESTDDTGTVALSATWTGLAATDGDRLVLTKPFANGFKPDRPFIVRAPDGYELQTSIPEPDARADGRATWSANQSLDGFQVVAQPADDFGDAATTDGSGPGFGVTAALLAALTLSALLGWSGRRD
jgi:hypothetical protein